MERTAASAEEVNDLTNLPPLDMNKTPRATCKNCGATLAGGEKAVGLCPLCQDDANGGRPHRQRQRQRLMRTTDGRTVTGSYDDDFIHADDDPVHGQLHPDVCPGCRMKYPHGNGEVCPTCQDEIIGSHAGEFDRRRDAEQAKKPLMERTTPIEHSTNGPAVMDMSRGRDDKQDPYERKIREHIGPRPPGLVPQVDHVQYGTPYTLWQHQLPTDPSHQDWLRRSLNALEDTLHTEADRGGSDNRVPANHPVTDIDKVLSNPRKKVRTGPYAGEYRLGRNLTARIDGATGDRVVRLHDTDIVRHHPNGDATYNSGGYATPTTRAALDQWGLPHHSFSSRARMMHLIDRHPDVAHSEHVDTQWGGYDRVTGVEHPFHDGMRFKSDTRDVDYDNAHPHQAESAPRGQGIWGAPYPYGHTDRHTQGAGQTVTPTDTRALHNRIEHPAPPGVHDPRRDDIYRYTQPRPRSHDGDTLHYDRNNDRRELADADRSIPDEGSYSGFTHHQPAEIHPPVGEFDVRQHLHEHHGYSPEHTESISDEHVMRFHDRDHQFGNSLATGDGTPHKHDDPLNDEAPPLPGEHFDDYNRRMNERQLQRMKQRGIEARVVRDVANAALRADASLSRQAALLMGHRAVERFPALTARYEEQR